MTAAARELAQAVMHLLSLRAHTSFCGNHVEKVEVCAVPGNAFDRLQKALEDVQAEANRRIRVTPDKSGLDNDRYEAMAGPLEAVIANMGLTTPSQVLSLCDMAYGQQGKVVVHTSSGCVSVREPGQFGRTMFTIKGEGPEWE